MILTTRGEMSADRLDKIDGFEQRAKEYVVWTEYRVKGDPPVGAFAIIPDEDMAKIGRVDRREVVRRDCHVIIKDPSVTADALAASFG